MWCRSTIFFKQLKESGEKIATNIKEIGKTVIGKTIDGPKILYTGGVELFTVTGSTFDIYKNAKVTVTNNTTAKYETDEKAKILKIYVIAGKMAGKATLQLTGGQNKAATSVDFDIVETPKIKVKYINADGSIPAETARTVVSGATSGTEFTV